MSCGLVTQFSGRRELPRHSAVGSGQRDPQLGSSHLKACEGLFPAVRERTGPQNLVIFLVVKCASLFF